MYVKRWKTQATLVFVVLALNVVTLWRNAANL